MKFVIFTFFVLLSLLPVCKATPQDQLTNLPSTEQQNTNQILLMNKMIAQVHLDLKALGTTNSWLSSYGDKCLYTGGSSIFYMPKLKKETGFAPQFPDQLFIHYEPISIKHEHPKGGEDRGIFQFPSLDLKVCAQIVIRGKENAGLADLIRQCIIKVPPHNLRVVNYQTTP